MRQPSPLSPNELDELVEAARDGMLLTCSPASDPLLAELFDIAGAAR
jgi:hypothetical protein